MLIYYIILICEFIGVIVTDSLVWPAPLLREEGFGSPYYNTVVSFTNIPDITIELVSNKPHCFYSGCGWKFL